MILTQENAPAVGSSGAASRDHTANVPIVNPGREKRNPIEVAFFNNVEDACPRMCRLSRQQLAERLTRHDARESKDGPLFSPTIYQDGARRAKENVSVVTLGVGDFDHGATVADVRPRLKPYEYVVYTTHNHTPEQPRFRVVIPFVRPVPAADWPDLKRRIDYHVFGQLSDRAAIDASRMYYLPSHPPGAEHFAFSHEGEALDPHTLPPVPTEQTKPTRTATAAPALRLGLDDQDVIGLAMNAKNGSAFAALWRGDTSEYAGDDSAADLGCCNYLAFYCSGPEQIDRLFRASGLYRPKWDERHYADGTTYGQATVDRAVEGRTEFYASGNNHQHREVPMPSMTEEAPATPAAASKPTTTSLAAVRQTFQSWLYMPDTGALDMALAAVVANRGAGDPVWLLLVGVPGSGKTEILNAMGASPDVYPVGAITEGSLLSGTSKKEKAADAKGGLLRQIGDFGILVPKDFGSVLSMNKDSRAQVLAALREIYDGEWVRHVGTDGGRELRWKGKIGLLGGCTPAIDHHHAVIGSLGERFIFSRIPSDERAKMALSALRHAGKEQRMRQALSDSVQGLLANVSIPDEPAALSEVERDRIIALAMLATTCRAPVIRDGYRRELEDVPGAEAPTRVAIVLRLLLGGLLAIGTGSDRAWQLLGRIAVDSMPLARRNVLGVLKDGGGAGTTTGIAAILGYPTVTVRRATEELACYGVLDRRIREQTGSTADTWQLSEWFKTTCNAAGVSEIPVYVYTVQGDATPLNTLNTAGDGKTETLISSEIRLCQCCGKALTPEDNLSCVQCREAANGRNQDD